MKYIVIGLGNYGTVLATELSALGHEVIGADTQENRVQAIKDRIATAFVLDSTQEDSMSVLPLKDVDVVIVAIGENFGASIRTVALLRQLKAKCIWARAIDEVHSSILQAFDIDRILEPEAYAAKQLVQILSLGVHTESLQIDKETNVLCFRIPQKWIGYSVNELKLLDDYKVKLLGVRRKEQLINAIGISIFEHKVKNELPEDTLMEAEDELVCYARYEDFKKLLKDMRL